MYEEELSESEVRLNAFKKIFVFLKLGCIKNLLLTYNISLQVMEMCKRLNPNIEVPDVTDLIQQLELMLQSDTTERKLFFNDNRGKDVSILFHS